MGPVEKADVKMLVGHKIIGVKYFGAHANEHQQDIGLVLDCGHVLVICFYDNRLFLDETINEDEIKQNIELYGEEGLTNLKEVITTLAFGGFES